MKNTKIAWADHTFNPWLGCDAVSAGCENCYARTMHERWNGKGSFGKRTKTSENNWKEPLKWHAEAKRTGLPVRVFCGSMCDWLDDQVPKEWLRDLLYLIAGTPNLTWLMLTKRPENFERHLLTLFGDDPQHALMEWTALVPVNLWFGVTAENQQMWDERVPMLCKIPASVHWVSAEPLLGRISGGSAISGEGAIGVDWIVAGGENGNGARECNQGWIEDLALACAAAGQKFFFKQWGKNSMRGNAVMPHVVEKVMEWPGKRRRKAEG
jgi:protein gp37